MEALLFASKRPVPESEISERLPGDADVKSLLTGLQTSYEARGVNLVKVGKAWAFRTSPEIAAQLMVEKEVRRKLSKAALETLSIIAYHQPVTRGEIEEVRGVSVSKGTIDVLFEADWIKPRGRRRTPGRPVTWGTTEGFLDHFGLEGLEDLPGVEELKASGLFDKRPAIDNVEVRQSQVIKSESSNISELHQVKSSLKKEPNADDEFGLDESR